MFLYRVLMEPTTWMETVFSLFQAGRFSEILMMIAAHTHWVLAMCWTLLIPSHKLAHPIFTIVLRGKYCYQPHFKSKELLDSYPDPPGTSGQPVWLALYLLYCLEATWSNACPTEWGDRCETWHIHPFLGCRSENKVTGLPLATGRQQPGVCQTHRVQVLFKLQGSIPNLTECLCYIQEQYTVWEPGPSGKLLMLTYKGNQADFLKSNRILMIDNKSNGFHLPP